MVLLVPLLYVLVVNYYVQIFSPIPFVQKWNANYKNKAKIIAVAVGKYADTKVLNKISEDVLFMANTQSDDMYKFISWITASIITQSKSVAFNSQENNLLDNIDNSVLKKVDIASSNKIDIDCAVLVGKCQHTKKPYLMKYDCNEYDLKYDLSGCYPIDNEYFAWSDTRKLDAKINTNELMGVLLPIEIQFPALSLIGNTIHSPKYLLFSSLNHIYIYLRLLVLLNINIDGYIYICLGTLLK